MLRPTRKGDWTSTIDWNNLLKYFSAVEALFKERDCKKPLTNELWNTVKLGFDAAVDAFAKEVEDESVAMVATAYSAENIATELVDEVEMLSLADGHLRSSSKEVVPSILLRGASLFKCEGKVISYAGLLLVKACANRRDHVVPTEFQEPRIEVPQNTISIARALLRHMSLPPTTGMIWLENLGKAFRCDRCLRGYGPFARVALTWPGLVS